ncbi:phospholipase D-like domain-containing protein [Aquabacter sp. L1I39]|uniref:phospholipase D-like domain-containing protein n=1 Tax=Aquabacter sp. L1I39 TaxID=2820278 RepID=UPI001FFDBB20|nr:phospholipase D-like domain-containing protein [Aquabacter sp. L1I39]
MAASSSLNMWNTSLGLKRQSACAGASNPVGAAPTGAHASALFREDRNCSRISMARRAQVLVDGRAYFAALYDALHAARHSILVVGWDFDGRIRLRPDDPQRCETLGEVLRRQVERHPDLHVRVLVWSSAVLHGPSAPAGLLLGEAWQDHPRISLRLDTTHPAYAAHHQKIVCLDGALAFTGGMDLTVDRWDTCAHHPDDPHRRQPDGTPFGPVHDVMLMLDGPAAADVCALANERWSAFTGEEITLPCRAGDPTLWPQDAVPGDAVPGFEDITLGLARSLPAWKNRERIAEAPRLLTDVLRAARRSLYIEAQYLTAHHVAELLERRLMEHDGPEIVAVVSDTTHSWFERAIMGTNRDRLLRRLARADRYDRLRVFHPVVDGRDGPCDILVHAKLMVADDRYLWMGSSNLNNRSVGLDSEFDVTLEASREDQSAAVAGIRNALLAEHLGATPERVAMHLEATGSLIRAVDLLNGGPRRLRPFQAPRRDGPTEPIPGTKILDPVAPFSWSRLWAKLFG